MLKKKITVPHNGPIYTKGGVIGPITTPFTETTSNISAMLMRSIRVNEVLTDGTQIALNFKNFDKDNEPKVEEVKEEVPAPPVVKATELKPEGGQPEKTGEESKVEVVPTKPKEAAKQPQQQQAKQQQQQQTKGQQQRNDQKKVIKPDTVVDK